MVSKGLIVRLEAAAGKEEELASFLVGALPLVDAEPETIAWFALRTGAATFAIVDAFPDEAGRQAHLDDQQPDSGAWCRQGAGKARSGNRRTQRGGSQGPWLQFGRGRQPAHERRYRQAHAPALRSGKEATRSGKRMNKLETLR